MKIGIFGGAFNPPHKMHKQIGIDLLKLNYVDKIIYVPVGDEYQKDNLVSFNHRINMVNLIIDNNNMLSSSIANNGFSYTYQVLDYFKEKYSCEICFICGIDNLKEFSKWKNYKYILKNYKLLIIQRNDEDINSILGNYNQYTKNIIITSISKNPISSSIIRNNIDNSELITKNLDKKVYRYIKNNNLYKQ